MKKVFFASMVLVLSMLLFSCSNFFSASSSDNEGVPNGKARVHFSVGKSGARTIMPESYTGEDIKLIELTAQKKGEETAYKFNGEKEKLSWNSLSELEKASIDIDYGTYTFVLNLSINEGDKNFLVQTCTLEDQAINAETKELAFNMQEDSGDISISISWDLAGDTNRIGMIKAGLYTIASKGETPLDITGDTAEKTLTISVDGASATAKGSYSSVPSGSYLIKLRLYDTETAENPFNIITDIIKINGYKTLYNLALDLDKLNIQYTAIFNPNGGTWEGGSTGDKATSRNMYSGFVPPEGVSKTGFELVGWYVFEDDVPSADLSKATSSDLLDPDKDYTLYAVWGHSVSGSFTTDNRALIIKTDIGADGVLYQNSKINLSVTDSAGEPVTDSVTYAAKILYKGKDINDLGGKTYYTVEGGVITLNGMTTPLPEAKYQLYVKASRALSGAGNSVTSSQTFNVKLEDRLATPTTQVALYNYDSWSYNYYLTNSDAVETTLDTADLTSNRNIIAFDAQGNFYTANYNDSTEPHATLNSNSLSTELPLEMKEADGTDRSNYFSDFVVDLAANKAYAAGINEYSLYLFKYPKLISDNSCDGAEYFSINESDFYPSRIAVNNNILYVLGTESGKDKMYVYDVSSDSATKLTSSGVDVTTYITDTMGFSSSATVTDIYALEGAVYILVSESSNGTSSGKNIYRRGSVIKYDPPVTPGGTGTATPMKDGIKTTPTIANTGIKKMTLYYAESLSGSRISDLYTDENERNSVVTVDGLQSKDYTGETAQELLFPDVYALSKDNADEHYLSSPAKVIAVKPKKLVIADDGIAFYTENDGCLSYKNMNRVVTIDLKEFVVESVQTTAAKFDKDISSYIRSTISLEPLASGGTVVASQEQGYFYVGSGDTWIPIDKAAGESNANTSKTYLSVKPGTTE